MSAENNINPERWQQIEQLCREALARPVSQRHAFLQDACLGDDTLRIEVEGLLSRQRDAEDFLGEPALQWMARELGREFGSDTVLAELNAVPSSSTRTVV